jgi:transcriptional/translational regulatory protein YebC/TACO1
MFEGRGVVIVTKDAGDEDEVFLVAADAGAEDVRSSEETIEVITPPESTTLVRSALEQAGVKVESSDITQVPKTTIELGEEDAKKVLRLIDALEELDDVQDVYANFDIPDDVLARQIA